MRRFRLPVLPSGFQRIRHYGLIANAGRRKQSGAGARAAASAPHSDSADSAVLCPVLQSYRCCPCISENPASEYHRWTSQ